MKKICRHYDIRTRYGKCRRCGEEFLFCPKCHQNGLVSAVLCEKCEQQGVSGGAANGYWACFEYENGIAASWSDYALNPDDFVHLLIELERKNGNRIKRFVDFYNDEIDGKVVFPEVKIGVRKYNQQLRRAQRPSRKERG